MRDVEATLQQLKLTVSEVFTKVNELALANDMYRQCGQTALPFNTNVSF